MTRLNFGGHILQESYYEKEQVEKLLLKLSIPIIISLLVSELYNMVDTLFVSNFVNASGIGALSVVFPVQRIVIALSIMIGIGTSTSFMRSMGAEDNEKAQKVISSGFTLALMIMVPLSTFVYFNSENILILLGASGEVLTYGIEYLEHIIFGSIFLSLTIFTSNIMISLNKSKIAITATSIGAIVNIIIDLILVKYLNMGVKGAAIATLISQCLGFLFAYYHLYKFKKSFHIKKGFTINFKLYTAILAVGVSAFIVEAEDGILMAILNNLLKNVAGNDGIIVLAAATKIYMFLFVLMFGMANAMQPIAAFNIGAKNFDRLKEVLQKTILYATSITFIVWSFSLIFAKTLLAIFIKDVHLLNQAVPAFRIMISAFPLISIYYISIFYFQSLGRAKHSIFISILRQVVIMIPLSVFLVNTMKMGAMGVWLSYPIADVSVALISGLMLYVETSKLDQKVELDYQT